MLLAVWPQTGPSLVWTVVPDVHDGGACAATAPACGAAEAPPVPATVSPATRAAAAATSVTAPSGLFPRGLFPHSGAALILFHAIVNSPEDVRLGSPLGSLARSRDGEPGRRGFIAAWEPHGCLCAIVSHTKSGPALLDWLTFPVHRASSFR